MSAQTDAVAALTAAVDALKVEAAAIVAAIGNPPADPAVVQATADVTQVTADLKAAVPTP